MTKKIRIIKSRYFENNEFTIQEDDTDNSRSNKH